MNNKKLSRICGQAAIGFVILCLLNLLRDAIAYNTTLNSAPFSVWILADAIFYLLPALGFWAAHLYFRKKS